MRILVTGAQGCIGAWVVKGLIERGLDVMIYDTDPSPHRLTLIASAPDMKRVVIETGDIQDATRMKTLVREGRITYIVHLAAVLMPFCQANPVEGGKINVIGQLNVFEAARDAGRPVRVVYASSSAVWGPEEVYGSGKLTEADPLRPSTHYGVFKQCNEGNARAFYLANGISSVGLRPWTVYGVGRDRGLTADPTLAIQALSLGQAFQIRLSGYMDLQYVEDVARTFISCLFAPQEGAHVFNLEGAVVEMQEFIGILDRLRPGASRLITAGGPQVPVAYRMDDSALRRLVPEITKTPLEQGIRATLQMFDKLRNEGRLERPL